MEYYVAPSYEKWEKIGEPYDKKGKPYIKIKKTCDRCVHGIYACRVENREVVPHPAYGGVCLKCQGRGYLYDEARVYTKAEHDRLIRNREAAAARRKQKKKEQHEKELAEAPAKQVEWLKKNSFSKDGFTYIIMGESYSIKDTLKEAGFKYDSVLKWHRDNNAGYEDKTIAVKYDEVVEFSPIGSAFYKTGAVDIINKKIAGTQFSENSGWVGETGDKIEIEVTFIRRTSFEGRYGLSNVYTFKDEEDNVFTWFTTSIITNKEVNDIFTIKGTIKEHTEFNGVKQTVLTRVKVVE